LAGLHGEYTAFTDVAKYEYQSMRFNIYILGKVAFVERD
jgi:hypothetical protein